MPSVAVVCQAHGMNMSEERKRYEIHQARRRARFERYRNKCNKKLESYSQDNSLSLPHDGSRLEVRVQSPVTHLPDDRGRFTTYEIAIETNNISFTLSKSYVRRRFSEFLWLRNYLKRQYGDLTPEELPPRTWWGGQFEPAVIELRLRGLQTFLSSILRERVYLSDKALHLFVQSQLSTEGIGAIAEGRDSSSVIDLVLGTAHSSRSSFRCSTCSSECTSNNSLCEEDDGSESSRYSSSSSDSDASINISTASDPPPPAARSTPITSPAPRRCESDSAISIRCSDFSDSSSCDSDASTSNNDSKNVGRKERRLIRSVLSQSVPVVQALEKCTHQRIRRVTFSTEVTVAKVVEKIEETGREGETVAIVSVGRAKGYPVGNV